MHVYSFNFIRGIQVIQTYCLVAYSKGKVAQEEDDRVIIGSMIRTCLMHISLSLHLIREIDK